MYLQVDPESPMYRNYLDISKDNEHMISYLDRRKQDKCKDNGWDLYNPDFRIKATAGKVIKAIAGELFTDKEIMEWVTNYKKEGVKGKDIENSEFNILKGEDIKWAYHEENYDKVVDGSTLHNSCMRYEECQGYFDIYCKNPEQVELLVITRNGAVRGRCLLWYPKGKDDSCKLFDRIYTITDSEAIHMKAYLEVEGYIDIYTNDDGEDIDIILDYGQRQIDKYPYMDTFKYLSGKTISNREGKDCIALETTEGSYNNTTTECPVCGEDFDEDDGQSVEEGSFNGEIVCTNCARYVHGIGGYATTEDVVFSKKMEEYILKEDAVYCFKISDFISRKIAIELWDGKYVQNIDDYYVDIDGRGFECDDENFVEIDGDWYGKDRYDIFWDEKKEIYELIN
jgi:hypothetical protein